VAPQGLMTPGRVQYLSIPWDGQRQGYQFGTTTAFVDLPFPRGNASFTVSATITPRGNTPLCEREFATLMLRRNNDTEIFVAMWIGFECVYDGSIEVSVGFECATFCDIFRIADVTELIRPNTPVTFVFVREGASLFIFANNTLIESDTEVDVFDMSNSLVFPMEIGQPIYPTPDEDSDLVVMPLAADVSDIRITETADFPDGRSVLQPVIDG